MAAKARAQKQQRENYAQDMRAFNTAIIRRSRRKTGKHSGGLTALPS
jgi:hypothetical protein